MDLQLAWLHSYLYKMGLPVTVIFGPQFGEAWILKSTILIRALSLDFSSMTVIIDLNFVITTEEKPQTWLIIISLLLWL